MTLPVPRLDDRSFQDLVDDAKRFIQQRCPEWTDHNVSDPGVTLIEAFAWMTDLTLYRLNRVPDRLYIKFLELLDMTLFPPKAASTYVDFMLSTVNPEGVSVPAGTIVSTPRTASEPPINFTTMADLEIRPIEIQQVLRTAGDQVIDLTDDLGIDSPAPLFGSPPQPGDALVLVLDRPAPQHTLHLDVDVVRGAGDGAREDRPPLRWEASNGDGEWSECLVNDRSAGFNRDGSVELRIPGDHQSVSFSGAVVPLVRCRVVPPTDTVPAYTASPQLLKLTGGCIGAATESVNATFVESEVVGESTGIAGQEFILQHAPVVISDEAFVLHVARPPLTEELAEEGPDLPRDEVDGWETQTWELRPDFADSDSGDHHFVLDRATGTIRFGPLVRLENGETEQYGAVPHKGSIISVPRYRVGGGARGNVATGAISVLRSSIPYVDRVTNLESARGGVDGETVEEAKRRGPLRLRARNRAVTVEDFEVLTREAAPEIKRVRCLEEPIPMLRPDDEPRAMAPGARVLVVPNVASADGRIDLADLLPDDRTLASVQEYLDRRRVVGTRVRVEPPAYLGLRVKARILAAENHVAADVAYDAERALYRYFNPVEGGPDGEGWPFGRAARIGEAYGVLQQVTGIDVVEDVALYFCHPRTGEGEENVDGVLDLQPAQLLLSNGHEITVVDS